MMSGALDAQREAYGSGSYADAVTQRLADFKLMLSHAVMLTGWQILGMFLIGAWFVRSGAIARPPEFSHLYRRLRLVAFPAGLALMLASFWMMPTGDFGRMDLSWGLATALAMLAGLLMCLGYVGMVVAASWSTGAVSKLLALLAPAGRMALSNYLAQSLVLTLVFYGYGLGYFEQLPRAWQLPFALALFSLQVAFSHWWLARFRFGPAEWVWRAATYATIPPMRLARA
jgi:uncharacterized protein